MRSFTVNGASIQTDKIVSSVNGPIILFTDRSIVDTQNKTIDNRGSDPLNVTFKHSSEEPDWPFLGMPRPDAAKKRREPGRRERTDSLSEFEKRDASNVPRTGDPAWQVWRDARTLTIEDLQVETLRISEHDGPLQISITGPQQLVDAARTSSADASHVALRSDRSVPGTAEGTVRGGFNSVVIVNGVRVGGSAAEEFEGLTVVALVPRSLSLFTVSLGGVADAKIDRLGARLDAHVHGSAGMHVKSVCGGSLHASGSGAVHCERMLGASLSLRASGSGRLTVDNAEVSIADIDVSGAASVRLSGQLETCSVSASGASSVHLRGCRDAPSVRKSGFASVHVS